MGGWIVRQCAEYPSLLEIVNADGSEIRTVSDMGFSGDERGMARLIAAAPCMLEALKAAQARLCEHCPPVQPGEPGEHSDECLAAMEAISKAEGA